jgi:hypothetical protein
LHPARVKRALALLTLFPCGTFSRTARTVEPNEKLKLGCASFGDGHTLFDGDERSLRIAGGDCHALAYQFGGNDSVAALRNEADRNCE